VKRKHLNLLAEKTGIPGLLISNTDNCNGIKFIYGDAFEALIGAIYLDKGYRYTREFILEKIIKGHVDMKGLMMIEADYKSRIIEWAQKNKKPIAFETREMYQENQRIPAFVSMVRIAGEIMGEGQGLSKKEAEQHAAEDAWIKNEMD
jgi:ribonuclease-3